MREVVLTQLVAAKRSEDGRLRDAEAWPKVRLGDVCEINLGKTPPRGDRRYWDNEKVCGVRWLSIADLAETQDGFVNDCKEYITREAIEQCGVPIVKAGTFLLSFKLTLGRTAIAGCDLCTNEAIAALPLLSEYDGKIDLGYLGLYCCFFDWDEYASKDEKVLGKTLNKKKLAEVPILLPPLAVQREIVERLEKELGAVDKMAKGFEKIAADADALFKAELKEVFEEVKRSGAETKRLEDVCENLDSRRIPITKCDRETGPYPYYGASGIVDYVKDYIFDGEFLLVSEDGANLLARSTPIAFSVSGKIWVNNHAHILSFKNSVERRFVELYFASISIAEYVTGAAQPKFTQKALNDIIIPVPPLAEQAAVVAKLDMARARCEKLKTAAEKGLQTCAKLRKAILKEAFA